MYFPFPEQLLHFIWQYQLLDSVPLSTKCEKVVQVLNQGQLQNNAGPDFANAKIEIDGIILFGNIEIHTAESKWYEHFHHDDAHYNTCILHVVWHSEKAFTRLENGQDLAILELKNYVPCSLLSRYEILQKSNAEIPCKPIAKPIPETLTSLWFEQLANERLTRKQKAINQAFINYVEGKNVRAY